MIKIRFLNLRPANCTMPVSFLSISAALPKLFYRFPTPCPLAWVMFMFIFTHFTSLP